MDAEPLQQVRMFVMCNTFMLLTLWGCIIAAVIIGREHYIVAIELLDDGRVTLDSLSNVGDQVDDMSNQIHQIGVALGAIPP